MNKKIYYFIGKDPLDIRKTPFYYASIDKDVAIKELKELQKQDEVKLFLIEITEVPPNA